MKILDKKMLWIFHDAEILNILTAWNKDGDVIVKVLCELNPDENLTSLEISTNKVFVEFYNVSKYKIFGDDNYSAFPIIDKLSFLNRETNDELVSCEIKTMSSLKIEIICTQVLLNI